jgi:hypothetical protein
MDSLIIKVGGNYKKHYFNSDDDSGLSLGRAFTNDIIIDDPYVGKSQLTIHRSLDRDRDWRVKITDHTNPALLNKKKIDAQEVQLRSGDVITIGRTNITFYTEDHAVPETRGFSFTNWLHNHKFKPYIAILMLLLLLGVALLMTSLEISTTVNWGMLASSATVFIVLALLWSSGWSLAGRLLKGDYYFSSHLFYTSLCLILALLAGDLGSYVDYMFSSPLAGTIADWLISVAVLGLLTGFGLALVSYSLRPIQKGMLISACIVSAIALIVYMYQPDYTSEPVHSVTVKPSFVPAVSPVSIDQYISNYDDMFDRLTVLKEEVELENL